VGEEVEWERRSLSSAFGVFNGKRDGLLMPVGERSGESKKGGKKLDNRLGGSMGL